MRELLIRGSPSRDAKLGSGTPHAAQIERERWSDTYWLVEQHGRAMRRARGA